MRLSETTKQTRQNIIEAFWQIYADKEIRKITVRELMEKAGYHRSVFYFYYKDVYELLEQEKELIVAGVKKLLPGAYKVIFGSERGSAAEDELKKFFQQNAPKACILLGRHGDMDFQYRVRQMILDNLMNVLKADKDDVRVKLAAEFFVTGHMNAILYLYEHRQEVSLDDYWLLVRKIARDCFDV